MMLPWLAHRGVGAGIRNDVIKALSITFYVLKHNKRKKGKKLATPENWISWKICCRKTPQSEKHPKAKNIPKRKIFQNEKCSKKYPEVKNIPKRNIFQLQNIPKLKCPKVTNVPK